MKIIVIVLTTSSNLHSLLVYNQNNKKYIKVIFYNY